MNMIELRLLSGYRRFLPGNDREKGATSVAVGDGATLGELLELSGIECGRPLVVLVNGRYAANGKVLADGDVVSVFPPVAGG